MHLWSFEISNTQTGLTVAYASPQQVKVTRRRCAASQVTCAIVPTDPAIVDLVVCEYALKAYRKNTLRFHGQISDPLVIASAGATVTASDPFYFLGNRRLQAELDYGNTDLSDIAWNLISHEDGRKPIHIRRGATVPSVKMDFIGVDGSVPADLIVGLNQRDQGIWFWIDPVDGVAGTLGELRTSWPEAGSLKPKARFEFGDGTLDNLVDYQLSYGLPLNGVRATGASIGTTANIPARRDDAASQAIYGLLEDDFSFTDLDDTTSLDKHALDKMRSTPPITITLTPKPYDPDAAGDIFVPALFDDFDAGDIVPVYIRDQQFTFEGNVRIGEVTVDVADDGESEQLEQLVVTVVP
jgi:hypothetical protein